MHPRLPRPCGTAFGVLRERCSLVAMLTSPYACMHMGAMSYKQHAGAVCLTPFCQCACTGRGFNPAVSIELRRGRVPSACFIFGGNRPCRPHNRQYAIAAPGYKQHAGAVCLTPFAPRPYRTRIQSCRVSTRQNKKAHRKGELFCFVGGDGGN